MKIEGAIKFLEQYTNSEVYTEKCMSAHLLDITALRSMPDLQSNAESWMPDAADLHRSQSVLPACHRIRVDGTGCGKSLSYSQTAQPQIQRRRHVKKTPPLVLQHRRAASKYKYGLSIG